MRATISKRLLMSATLIGVTSWAGAAYAVPVTLEVFKTFSESEVSMARDALNDLTAGVAEADVVTEDFEVGFTSGDLTGLGGLDTRVGIFRKTTGALNGTGVCDQDDADCSSPGILNADGSPFNGRFNTTDGGENWLDSNDVSELAWEIDIDGSNFNNLAFFITDMGDVEGTLTVQLENGELLSVNIEGQPNGAINLITAEFSPDVMSAFMTFSNSNTFDGFGIDDPTVFRLPGSMPDPADPDPSPAPEPATLALIGTGLAGLGLASRRRRRAG